MFNIESMLSYLTFIGVLLTIYYTRKNIKTTKYIETITNQRILWLEKMRLDISELINLLSKLQYKEFENKHEIKVKLFEKITLIKLRLNPEEDHQIIKQLDNIKNTIQNISEKELDTLILSFQIILKNEWEKVKKEVDKGHLIKKNESNNYLNTVIIRRVMILFFPIIITMGYVAIFSLIAFIVNPLYYYEILSFSTLIVLISSFYYSLYNHRIFSAEKLKTYNDKMKKKDEDL